VYDACLSVSVLGFRKPGKGENIGLVANRSCRLFHNHLQLYIICIVPALCLSVRVCPGFRGPGTVKTLVYWQTGVEAFFYDQLQL
jgi:hypothetical protein